MNKQIYEFADQAGATRVYIGSVHEVFSFTKSELDEFARLLVQECVTTIQLESMNSNDEWEQGLVYAQDAILNHFEEVYFQYCGQLRGWIPFVVLWA